MNYKRKEFLQLSGRIAAAIALAPALSKSFMGADETSRIKKIGLQLYTLRDVLPDDPKGILKQVAAAGYQQVESYEGKLGMFWGMSNIEFKKYMDQLGMTIISSHCDIKKDFVQKAQDAAAIGIKYLMSSSLTEKKKPDEVKKIAEDLNHCGEICKKEGIRFAYHAEDHDFVKTEGQLPMDIIMQYADPAVMDFEMDIYWFSSNGQDPETWLKKYPGRFLFCHIKDRIKGSKNRDASCDLGTGEIDLASILKTARKNGMKYFIVEQEKYDNTTPLKCIVTDADYMKKLVI